MSTNRLHPICRSSEFCRLAASLALGFVLSALLLVALAGLSARPVTAQEEKELHVVVEFDDQARVVRSVRFGSVISGLAALQLSGLEVVTITTDFGPAVCSIEGVGCPAANCFCDPDRFWNYTYWDGTDWQSYPVGASSSTISQTGAVEGWRWGKYGAGQVPATPSLAAQTALTWLRAQQMSDGGYGNASAAVESLLAASANHEDAESWQRSFTNPALLDYVRAQAGSYARTGAAAAGKIAVALAASDACLSLGTLTPHSYYSPTLAAYSAQSGPNSWAILGTLALSETLPAEALDQLRTQRLPSGGWEWAPGWGADTNTTALALQAVVAAGEPVSTTVVRDGLAFLHAAQNDDGGFAYAPGPAAASDVNSTAYVVQALVAIDEDPAGPAWTIGDSNPISYLLEMQLPDGSLEWQPGSGPSLLATQQAIPALLGRVYPLRRHALATCPTVYLPAVARR